MAKILVCLLLEDKRVYMFLKGSLAKHVVNLCESLASYQANTQMEYPVYRFFEYAWHKWNKHYNDVIDVQEGRKGWYSVDDFIKLATPMSSLTLYPDASLFRHKIRNLKRINRTFHNM